MLFLSSMVRVAFLPLFSFTHNQNVAWVLSLPHVKNTIGLVGGGGEIYYRFYFSFLVYKSHRFLCRAVFSGGYCLPIPNTFTIIYIRISVLGAWRATNATNVLQGVHFFIHLMYLTPVMLALRLAHETPVLTNFP